MKPEIYIKIRTSEELKKEIKTEAEKLGLSVSAYMIMLHKIRLNNKDGIK